MNILFSVQADQIEVGDQILVDGDPIEVTGVADDVEDAAGVIVWGFSHDSGDSETYTLPFDYDVDVWSV